MTCADPALAARSTQAFKVVSFSDLAGHERYLATTLAGLTGTAPDFVLLIVGANAGLIGMSKVRPRRCSDLSFSSARTVAHARSRRSGAPLGRTRALAPDRRRHHQGRHDACACLRADGQAARQVRLGPPARGLPDKLTHSRAAPLDRILKSPGCRKKPVFVNDDGMACELAAGFAAEKACPIFRVSNLTGEGLGLLRVRALPSPRLVRRRRGGGAERG